MDKVKTKSTVSKVPAKKATPKPAKVENITWPKITVGSHLTVTEFDDGRTILAWDDAVLLQEVRAAIASVENQTTTESKPKRSTKTK